MLKTVVATAAALLAAVAPGAAASLNSIQHVVLIVQENRSFDDLFEGYPNARTSSIGKLPDGSTVRLQPIPLTAEYDISHTYQDAKSAYDGGAMDGFAYEYAGGGGSRYAHPQYGYVPRREVGPYWDLAQSYVLADNMFSQLDGSYVAHQYLIAGWAGMAYNFPAVEPWGCDSPSTNAIGLLNASGQPFGLTFPCFSYKTIADELDAKGITWRYYSPSAGLGYSWDAYDAVSQIRKSSIWKKADVHPETRILKDVAAGSLAAVTWIVPSMPLSDHAGSHSARGPSWVASVVNAIGKSKFWSSTAIFVTWDDWGGWYDDVAPPQYDHDGLGFRVPLLCISPYAKKSFVDHTQYEFGSLLKFIETRFGLPSLKRTDARATAPMGCFSFQQQARPFAEISAPLDDADVIRAAADGAPDAQ